MIADDILKDLKEVKKEKLTRLDKEIEYQRVFEDRVQDMSKEKELLG
jgi:hypothetical protein